MKSNVFVFLFLALFAVQGFAQGQFKLLELPYAPGALAPTISEQTILLHHGKHLQG